VCASSCVCVCGCTCVRAPCCVYNSVQPFVAPYIRRSLVQMSSPKTVLFSKRTLTIDLNRHKCTSIYIHMHMWVHACVHLSVCVQVYSTLYHHDTNLLHEKKTSGVELSGGDTNRVLLHLTHPCSAGYAGMKAFDRRVSFPLL